MDNYEICQITETTLDSGKKRIVGLRADGVVMFWNWETGEWTGFMSPGAAEKKGLQVSPALTNSPKTHLLPYKTTGVAECEMIPSSHVDKRPGAQVWQRS